MTHGRNHDERQFKAAKPRVSNVPEDEPETDLEAELLASGRGGIRPPQGTIGATEERGQYGTLRPAEEGEGPVESGSTVAPTKRAEDREHERHRIERELGRVAAGTEGARKAHDPGVSRKDLERAAREADERVGGPRTGPEPSTGLKTHEP